MTADNEPEFTTFSELESLGSKVYFAHPYSSWERPQNERHNGLLREFIPKRTSIDQYTVQFQLAIYAPKKEMELAIKYKNDYESREGEGNE